METYKMYIDGAFVDAENGDCYNSINPFNGEAIAKIPIGNVGDVNKAVAAARNAFDHGPHICKKSYLEDHLNGCERNTKDLI